MFQNMKFSLDSIEKVDEEQLSLYEQKKQDRFVKVRIKAFSDGENAHTEPVDFEVLKKSADSVYDIPLICELNYLRNNKDFGTHGLLTGSQFSFGFVKESKDNPIVFEKDEDTGKTFITIYAIIWKKYFSNIVEILESKDNKTEVSVEMDILSFSQPKKNKKIKVDQFVLNAITFLGNITTAGCPGAEASLCFSNESQEEFTKAKAEYIKNFEEGSRIEIDNSKEAAVDTKWQNPKQKLLNPILNASNKDSLLKEAYLVVNNEGEEEITLSDVKYPHHIIKDNKLILNIRGVQAAFSRASQQNIVKGKVKEHLLRHYKELGLDTENFEEFGLTNEEFTEYFAEFFDISGKEEKATMTYENKRTLLQGVIENCWVRDMDDEKVYFYDYKEEKLFVAPYEIIDGEGDVDKIAIVNLEEKQQVIESTEYVALTDEQKFECKKFAEDNNIEFNAEYFACKPEEEEVKEEGSEEEVKETEIKEAENADDNSEKRAEDEEKEPEDKEEKDEYDGDEEAEMSVEELKAKCLELETKLCECEEKIANMADYEELKTFKAETIAAQQKEEEIIKMNKVFDDLKEKGVEMSDEEKSKLLEDKANFENVDAWSNYVKAFALDNKLTAVDGIVSMQLPAAPQIKETKGIWDNLKSQF